MFDFIDISWIDVIDVLMVGLLIYWLIRVVRGTSAVNIFLGILLLYVIWIASRALGMKLLSFILGQVLGVGVVALLVIFQPEIRRFLLRISSSTSQAAYKGLFSKLFRQTARSGGMRPAELEELTAACSRMADTKTGALIALRHNSGLGEIIDTGDEIDARISRRLIENIFFKNSPLHDGAMILSENRILAARCTLPITQRQDIPAHYGMRHRAAIGLSEACDASVIVVSEETGHISFVQEGQIKTLGSITELRLAIEQSYK
ncbi:MAG: diadenylate cyclase CdaA [Bacteroidales bacterium]|nr:diadenylate cyclase CdaA [Bacteroidales bacterium]MBR0255414.1 diadenylate cyclase CdaA [Bacteroidales bacterium]